MTAIVKVVILLTLLATIGQGSATDFTGKFQLTSSEKLDEFLTEVGVDDLNRKQAQSTSTFIELTKDGNVYTLKSTNANMTSEIKFELGKEFDETRTNGVTVKSVFNAEGNKLVQKQFGDKEVTIVSELNGNVLKTVGSVGNVTTTAIYNRV